MTSIAVKTCPLAGAQKFLLLGWFLSAADDTTHTAERLRGGASPVLVELLIVEPVDRIRGGIDVRQQPGGLGRNTVVAAIALRWRMLLVAMLILRSINTPDDA